MCDICQQAGYGIQLSNACHKNTLRTEEMSAIIVRRQKMINVQHEAKLARNICKMTNKPS